MVNSGLVEVAENAMMMTGRVIAAPFSSFLAAESFCKKYFKDDIDFTILNFLDNIASC